MTRLKPTHYIKVWIGIDDGHTHMNSYPKDISHLTTAITMGATPVALFLISPKTQKQKDNWEDRQKELINS